MRKLPVRLDFSTVISTVCIFKIKLIISNYVIFHHVFLDSQFLSKASDFGLRVGQLDCEVLLRPRLLLLHAGSVAGRLRAAERASRTFLLLH